MDGVTILNMTEKYVSGVSDEAIGVLFFFIGASIVVACLFGLEEEGMIYKVLLWGATFVLGATLADTDYRDSKTVTQYEVTIDESISYAEFTSHYTLIEQRGDIYVVELKEGEE